MSEDSLEVSVNGVEILLLSVFELYTTSSITKSAFPEFRKVISRVTAAVIGILPRFKVASALLMYKLGALMVMLPAKESDSTFPKAELEMISPEVANE